MMRFRMRRPVSPPPGRRPRSRTPFRGARMPARTPDGGQPCSPEHRTGAAMNDSDSCPLCPLHTQTLLNPGRRDNPAD
ncbi:hypothetical protein BCEP4_1860030 [Burkholderia cepacia]|nr:hypothetical protein BCEP4_1860030 [Burkholderia cepacia]